MWVRTGGFARCAKIYPALSYVWYIFFARVRQFSELCPTLLPALVICQLWWSGKYGSTVSIMPWQLLMLMCAQLKPKGPVVSSYTFTLKSCQLLMQEKENAAKTFKNPELRCARAQKKDKFWEQQSLRCSSNNSSILTSHIFITYTSHTAIRPTQNDS